MAEMSKNDLISNVRAAELDAKNYSNSYMPKNRQFLEYYNGCPNGLENDGDSQVTSTDVADVIGSDMPAHVRIFLSGAEILQFEPNTDEKRDILEAKEKTKYTHHIIRSQPNAFKIYHDWIKEIEIQSFGVLYYYWDEVKSTSVREYNGLDEDVTAALLLDLEDESKKQKFEFEEDIKNTKDGTSKLTIKITRTKKGVVIKHIPIENFRISTNAISKEEATLVGHVEMARRGDLIAQLPDKDKDRINKIPASTDPNDSDMKRIRFAARSVLSGDGAGTLSANNVTQDKSNDMLVVSDMSILIDFDGDGIPERRHIVKIGDGPDSIFVNEPFDHVNYAISSAILMPGALMGRSRAEITMESQLKSTTIEREMMGNIYNVGSGRVIVNERVNMDDLLTNRLEGVVRTSDIDARLSVAQLETPFIGDKTLLIMQYVKSQRAASTGEMLPNQGLNADKIYNETATRFEGVRDAGAAKLELVARVIGELGWKDLMEGVAWLVTHNQSDRDEIMVLGKKMEINPTRWWNDHKIKVSVGLGAGDDETVLSNMTGLFQIQTALKAEGSNLVDDKDRFNTLKRIVEAMREHQVSDFFNEPSDPEQSAQFLLEQNEKLMTMLEQMKSQQGNQLAEAAMVEQQGKVAIAQGNLVLKIEELKEKSRQFDQKLASEGKTTLLELERDYTKIEAENQIDIPGKGA